ncbi:hypothetical protein BYT27DRAFT_7295447 [Phlegmacium glaucopus]|nr:hypothetical protein BYT27DRAFT_7295447 [Phlegmacium glaucopus]
MPTSSSAHSSSPGLFSPSQLANSPVGDQDTEQQCFKRLYLSLKAQVDSGDEPVAGKKRKSGSGAVTTTKIGRGIPKMVLLFSNIRTILEEADCHDLRAHGLADELDLEDFIDLDKDTIDNIKKRFDLLHLIQACAYVSRGVLFRLIPNLKKKMQEEPPEALLDYFKLLEKGAMNRGIQHDLCGLLLYPIEFEWKNESVRAKLRAFSSSVLYKGFKGTTNDYELGFLQSSLLVKVYKHIFTSPTSAKDGSIKLSDVENDAPAPRSRKFMKLKKAIQKDVTSSLQMNGKVSSRSIAYAVIQLLFNLWDTSSWTPAHTGFNFHTCYCFIINFFDAAHGPNAKAHA